VSISERLKAERLLAQRKARHNSRNVIFAQHRRCRCTGIFELAVKFLSNLSQNSLQSLKHVNFKISFTLSSEFIVS